MIAAQCTHFVTTGWSKIWLCWRGRKTLLNLIQYHTILPQGPLIS